MKDFKEDRKLSNKESENVEEEAVKDVELSDEELENVSGGIDFSRVAKVRK